MTGVFLFLIKKTEIAPVMTIDGTTQTVPAAPGTKHVPVCHDPVPAPPRISGTSVNLVDLAWVRSGDKGHLFNVAAIARKPEYLPFLQASFTAERVGDWYQHLGPGGEAPRVEAFDAPGLNAINFVVHDALTGGINASTALDSAAKGMGQMLLRFPVSVPAKLADQLNENT